MQTNLTKLWFMHEQSLCKPPFFPFDLWIEVNMMSYYRNKCKFEYKDNEYGVSSVVRSHQEPDLMVDGWRKWDVLSGSIPKHVGNYGLDGSGS